MDRVAVSMAEMAALTGLLGRAGPEAANSGLAGPERTPFFLMMGAQRCRACPSPLFVAIEGSVFLVPV